MASSGRIDPSGPNDVIDLTSRLIDNSRQLASSVALPLDADFGKLLSLGGGRASQTYEAKKDLEDAKASVQDRFASYVIDSEHHDAIAAAFDGLNYQDRPLEQRQLIREFISDIGAARFETLDTFSEFAFRYPEFRLTEEGAPGDVELSALHDLVPSGIAVVFVPGDEGTPDDHVLVNGNLGFRDMHIAAQTASAMSIGHQGRLRGINVADGRFSTRFLLSMQGDFVDLLSHPERFRPLETDSIFVRLDNKVREVDSEYIQETLDWALPS